jgi:diguanylate cyclase (GGDEF)-like protein/putative nucleotidyltransferase with HDIG domain
VEARLGGPEWAKTLDLWPVLSVAGPDATIRFARSPQLGHVRGSGSVIEYRKCRYNFEIGYMSSLPRPLRSYLMVVYIVTFSYVAIASIRALPHGSPVSIYHQLSANSVFINAMIFLVIAYFGERSTLQVTGSISQSLSTTAHICAMLLFPAPVPMLVTLVAVGLSQLPQRDRELYKRLFNLCHPTLTIALSSLLCATVKAPDTILRASHFGNTLPYLLLLVASYYLLDAVLLLTVITLLQGRPFWLVWADIYLPTLLPELSASTIGVLAAIAWRFDPLSLSLVILPVMALRLAFRAISQAEERAIALLRRGEQLEAVLQAGQRLRVQHGQVDLLYTMAEAARALSGAEVVAGYLQDPDEPAQLERLVVVPEGAPVQGPTRLAVTGIGGVREVVNGVTRILLVPLELQAEGIAGMLHLAGVPDDFAKSDHNVLTILATQAAIALQNTVLHERALALASSDGLTELANHRNFQTRLEEEVARARRSHQNLTVMMVDLDDFKSVNNTYGHQTGDAMLKAVAGSLSENVRTEDIPARYGGDEFAIILPDTSIDEGLLIAERVRTGIAALRVVDGERSIRIGASVGVATLPLHAQARDTLIRAADKAAYAAKHTGKDRVCQPQDAVFSLDMDPAILAERLEHANMDTVQAFAAAVDAKDPYTRGHSHRVSAYAAILASSMQLSPMEVAAVRLAGLLHDVGKIGIPDAILTKPGRLNEEEYAIIQQHSILGEHMLQQIPFLQEILPAVRHHHERWDGGGYPDNLSGTSIPRDAAILMVADSFDAMTSSRTYRQALPLAEAVRRMREGSGAQFDPRLVEAFEREVSAGRLAVLGMDAIPEVPVPLLPSLPPSEAQLRLGHQEIALEPVAS